GELGARERTNRTGDRAHAHAGLVALRDECGPTRGGLGAGPRPVAPVDSGKHGLEAGIVALGGWIALVVVTTRTVDSQALDRGHRVRKHVIAVDQAGLELVDGPLAQLDVPDEIPGASRDETGGDDAFRIAREEDVARELLADETAVMHIVIKCAD